MKAKELMDIRRQIDILDQRIMELLNKRMEICLKTRRFKKHIVDLKREEEVLENIRRSSYHLLRPDFSERLYSLIIEESRAIQQMDYKLIGFQGEHGAYSEAAILSYRPELVPVPCREFKDIFDDIEAGILDYGIVPIENSIEGAVTYVNDLLIERNLVIIKEIIIPVHHCLLALPGTDFKSLKAVYSHPQALAQCRNFIMKHKLEPKPFYDTAGAAKMLSEEKPEASCVIANRLSARLYHLSVIRENIEDYPSNSTRFIVLSKDPLDEEGDKCSIIFSLQHKVGALFSILKIFYEASVNLTRIESRPTKESPGNYVFFIDFEGSNRDE